MSLIRGTQLLGHTVRMGGQSGRVWLRWVSIIWLLALVATLYIRFDEIHISNFQGYCQATWYRMTFNQNARVELIDREATMKKRAFYEKYMRLIKKQEPESAGLSQVIKYPYTPENVIKSKAIAREFADMNHIWWSSLWYSLILSICISLGIFFLVARRDSKTRGDQFIRGRRIVTTKELIQIINKDNKKAKIDKPYTIGGIPYVPLTETEHLMTIIAATGTGKTILNKDLISQIKERGDKAIIYDYIGAFTESFYDPEKDILINPFDKRSKSWCLLKEASLEAEFDTIAAALIGSKKDNSDPFWPNGARLIFSELCKKQFREGNYSTRDLYNYLIEPIEILNETLAKTLAANFTSPESEKTTLSLLMMLTTHLRGLQYIKNDENNDFSIKDWILDRDNKSTVFLTSRPTLHDSIQPLISAMMDIAINNLGELPVGNKQKTWLIFDEVASLNYLPSLEKGLTISRNYGGCFVLSLQSISQLQEIYGNNKSETMTSNCKSKIIMNISSEPTAKWASNLIGVQEIEEHKEALSYGAHEVRDGVNLNKNSAIKSLVLPTEILALPKFKGYALMSGGYPVAPVEFENLKYNKYKFSNPAFIPL